MTDEKAAVRRQRRAAARREQILDAATKVFAEKGFARATTREIADAADVSEGTIYNYFASKEDLLIGIMERVAESELLSTLFDISDEQRTGLQDLQEQMARQEPAGSAREFFLRCFYFRQRFARENKPMLQALLAEMLINAEMRTRYNEQLVAPFISLIEQQMAARVELGQLRPLDVPLYVRFLAALNLGMLGLLILGDPLLEEKWDSQEMVQELTDFLVQGVGDQREAQD
jgi:TetR/AcrR family fatty acid metabolism transcriptional regulator